MALDLSAWHLLEPIEQVAEGNRNEVWRGSLDGTPVSIRRSRRSEASLTWELDLIDHLSGAGLRVPAVIDTDDGRRHDNGIVVQKWLHGRAPETNDDWRRVATALQRLHQYTPDYPQRPDCCAVAELTATTASVDADMRELPSDVANEIISVFATVADLPQSAIHGDPTSENIRIDAAGTVGLLDFDESRVDVAWHDLSNLDIQVLDDQDHRQAMRLSNAWEAANAWVAEPKYARTRLEALRTSQS